MSVPTVVRSDALDYVDGVDLALRDPRAPDDHGPGARGAPVRRLDQLLGVGVAPDSARDELAAPTQAVLAGLAGERVPFALQVTGGDSVSICLGTWGDDVPAADGRLRIVQALLAGAYPAVDSRGADAGGLGRFPVAALVQGVPRETRQGRERGEAWEASWDRLLRALHGIDFGVLVLAEPVPHDELVRLRRLALEDMRIASAAPSGRTEVPVALAYTRRLEAIVGSLDLALVSGGWRTAVHLLGHETTFPVVTAAWRAAFAPGDQPVESLRVVRSAWARELAVDWRLPAESGREGPRLWRHPYEYQTLLDTDQLARIGHLPRHDVPGFALRPAPRFALNRRSPGSSGPTVTIGSVLGQSASSRRAGAADGPVSPYDVPVNDLARHVFVAGLTGSGKTNTLMHLLTEAREAQIPFLVIEPAKTEYRELLGRPGVGDGLRVFTLGRESVAPLRLNPFEIPDGTDVSTHLDLLRTVFEASFALGQPLPQVLERCLVDLYEERGWDFATGRRGGHELAAGDAVPTLSELIAEIERTVPKLGFKAEDTQTITAGLTTRLGSLRRGARGLMLDVRRSVPFEELLSGPAVIELEALGDDADKAFVMGLLLVRLYEHRRAEHAARLAAAAAAGKPAPQTGILSHLVVVEEAHRLLAQSHKATDSWNADPKGAFAESFSQMLSEARAYGQGFIIADQVPVRLAPDVIKNTNLKIVHRLVSGDDREAMASAMSMDEDQSRALPTLEQGHAVVFSEGDAGPLRVRIRKAKNLDATVAVDDVYVRRAMDEWRRGPAVAQVFEGAAPCGGACPTPEACRRMSALADLPAGRALGVRMLGTMTADPCGIDVVWPSLRQHVAASAARTDDPASLVVGFALHALRVVVGRRALQGAWAPAGVEALTTALGVVVRERAVSDLDLGITPARAALRDVTSRVMARTFDPYPLCGLVCPDGSCRFRDAMSDLLLQAENAVVPDTMDDPVAVYSAGAQLAKGLIIAADDMPSELAGVKDAFWQAAECGAQVKFVREDGPQAIAVISTAFAFRHTQGVTT